MSEVLKVFLWGQEIGRLAWHDARKTTFFVYNPEFLKGTLDIAPLAASIHNPLSTRAIFGEAERIYQKLPSFIADSLPDAWGNQLFEQWKKDNKLTERNVTSLEKLAFIGERGMGALEFVPEIKRGSLTGQIDIKALADLAEKIALEREREDPARRVANLAVVDSSRHLCRRSSTKGNHCHRQENRSDS